MGNRKAFEKQWLDDIEEILPGSLNVPFYKQWFAGQTDEQIDELVKNIEAGLVELPMIVPIFSDSQLQVDRNLALGEKWGHVFFERIWFTDPQNPDNVYLTPKKYLVVDQTMRRQAQTIENKMGVPMTSSNIDELSGQVTGRSKGSSMTNPEAQIMYSTGLTNSLIEFLNGRGGNMEVYRAMEKSIIETGSANLNDVDTGETRPKTVQTLSNLLKAAHIGNNM